jgi:hypothetical protein
VNPLTGNQDPPDADGVTAVTAVPAENVGAPARFQVIGTAIALMVPDTLYVPNILSVEFKLHP